MPLHTRPGTILDEAKQLVTGDRNDDYGPPSDDMARTAKLWSAYLEHPIKPSDVPAMMILLKMSRQRHRPKRDNWVDAAGYAHCGQLCDTVAAKG